VVDRRKACRATLGGPIGRSANSSTRQHRDWAGIGRQIYQLFSLTKVTALLRRSS
jgi:hypothetical protein